MEVRELNHKRALAEAEKEMRLAQEDLRVTIRNINLAAGDLTASEKIAIYEAAAAYYWLTEKSILYKDSVFQAQQKVDTLKAYKERFCDTMWNGSELVGYVDYYKQVIEDEEAHIARLMEQYEAIPDTSATVAEWKAYVDGYDKAKDIVNKELADLAFARQTDSTMNKEAIRDFDTYVAEWVEENWEKDGDKYIQPLQSAGDEPDKDDPKYYTKAADSLKFVLTQPKIVEDIAWAKFIYLMNSYKTNPFPASKNTPKSKVLTVNPGAAGEGDTATIIVNSAMKEFLMGAAGNGEKSQVYQDSLVANYGLWGILDILKRDKVIGEHETPTPEEIAKLKKAMEDAEKAWDKDHKILVDGLAAFEDFTTADAELVYQVAENGKGAQKMVKAVNDLRAAILATGTKFSSFDGNDSVKLFDAIVEFAQAREDYLEFTCATAASKIKPDDPSKRDSSVFYYSTGKSGGGKAMYASKKFSALTFSELEAGAYNYIPAEPGNTWFTDTVTTGTITKVDSVVNGFANILSQMGVLVNIFDFANDTVVPGNIADTDTLTSALYGKYKVDKWKDATMVTYADGSEYVPTDLANAEEDFYKAIQAYYDAYTQFWADTLKLDATDTAKVVDYINALQTKKKVDEKLQAVIDNAEGRLNANLDPECYTKKTFKPYDDEAPIVGFTSGVIVPTHALSAVLYSVDPNKGAWTAEGDDYIYNHGDVEGNSAIFKASATDMWKYMKAAYDYYEAVNDKASENIAAITKIIQNIDDTIQKDIDGAGKFDEKQYNDDVALWKKNKEAADKYYAAKKAFVGVNAAKSTAKKEVLNDVYIKAKAGKSGRDTVVSGDASQAKLKANGLADLFKKNILGEYVGWDEDKIGGAELAKAKELFGDEPWVKYNEMNEEEKQLNAQLTELDLLKAKASAVFTAAAKLADIETVAGGTDTDWEKTYEKYVASYKALREAIVKYDEDDNIIGGKVKTALDDIENARYEIATFKSEGPNWDGKISKAENELEVLKNRQKTVDQALKVAKENYDRLREYLLSQDGVSYVIPVSTADIDDAIMNIDYVLRTLGHTVADIYAEVADKIGA
jgi:hypothetical protein